MNVLILHGSCRVNGVPGQLADEFARGAKDAGHHVTKVELREKDHKGLRRMWSMSDQWWKLCTER